MNAYESHLPVQSDAIYENPSANDDELTCLMHNYYEWIEVP